MFGSLGEVLVTEGSEERAWPRRACGGGCRDSGPAPQETESLVDAPWLTLPYHHGFLAQSTLDSAQPTVCTDSQTMKSN